MLLDRAPAAETLEQIQQAIEADADNRITDLHVWRLGPRSYGAIISLVTHQPRDPKHYKALLKDYAELQHITVEVNHCEHEPCISN